MTLSLFMSCFWVLAATIVAFLPMKRQYMPGVVLLVAAPFLILWLGYDHGWWFALIGVFGFVSMFRNPLIFLYRRFRGIDARSPE